MKLAIWVDWLALQFQSELRDTYPFRLEKLTYGSRQFRTLYDVYYFDDLWGHISADPVLPSLDKDFFLLKLENSWLYRANCYESILSFQRAIGSQYKGISRVDLCGDFNAFKGNYNPASFIRRVMAGEVDNLSKTSVAAVRGPKGDDPFESLTMGSRASAVRTYLYNKTKEMKDVKWKEWIYEGDKAAGLDMSRDIWRLEVSLKAEATTYSDPESGELKEMMLCDLFRPDMLQIWYKDLITKYFRFIPHSTDSNRYRYNTLKLMDYSDVVIRRHVEKYDITTSRADRIFAAKLAKETQESKRMRIQERFQVITWAAQWIAEHQLTQYIHRRRLNTEL